MKPIDNDIEEFNDPSYNDGFDNLKYSALGDRQDYELTAEQAGLIPLTPDVIS